MHHPFAHCRLQKALATRRSHQPYQRILPNMLPRVVIATALVAAASAAGNRWLQSNVVVLRVNDDVLGGGSSQLTWIDEVNPSTGALVGSFGPLVGSGPDARRATLSTTYPRDGWMQRSQDRRFLTFMAMDVSASSPWPKCVPVTQ